MNLTKIVLLSLLCPVLLTACSKKNDVSYTSIKIMVGEGQIMNASNLAIGATVNVYEDSASVANNVPKYTQITDDNGMATFNVVSKKKYYVLITKGTKKNYINGMRPIGIFSTQADIDNSPAQTPPAVIGGIKFQDTNGDGVVNANDKTPPPSIALNYNGPFVFIIY